MPRIFCNLAVIMQYVWGLNIKSAFTLIPAFLFHSCQAKIRWNAHVHHHTSITAAEDKKSPYYEVRSFFSRMKMTTFFLTPFQILKLKNKQTNKQEINNKLFHPQS